MSSLPRAVFIAGTLLASVTLAQAGGRAATESYPNLSTLGDRPLATVDPPASRAMVSAESPVLSRRAMRSARRGRRSRFARGGRWERLAKEARPTQMVTAAASVLGGPGQASWPTIPAAQATIPPGEEHAARTPGEIGAAPQLLAGPHEAGSPTLTDLIAKHAQQNGVPVELARAVVRIESRGNPHASNGGALGLMQIKPGTARAAGFSGGSAGLFVADTNLHFGMKILGDAYRSSGGNVCRALMLYQSGHLATRMSRANRAYCSRARAVMAGA